MNDSVGDLEYDLAAEIAQEEIATYIRIGLDTMDTDGEETTSRVVYALRHLHLAEPWLPAVAITRRLRAAGLLNEEPA